MSRTYWMVGDAMYGTGKTNSYWVREQWVPEPTRGYAFFCMTCGSVWARVWSETTTKSWWPACVPCEQHGGGLLLKEDWFLDGYIDDVPVAVFRREFLIESERLTKEIENDTAYRSSSTGS